MKYALNKIIFFIWLLTSVLCMLPCILFAQFTITSSINNATCSNDNNGSISVSVSGGVTPYTYLWKPGGEVVSSIANLKPGMYTVTIADSSGMDTTVLCAVGPSPILNDTIGRINAPLCANNGFIMLSISGGTGSYQYDWNTGSTNAELTELAQGMYSVIVTDGNSCTVSYDFSLTEKACFVSPEPYFTPNGDGYNDTWIISNSEHFENARLIIFDRWGTKVYEHKGKYESWDGKSYLGIPVPDAAYYYFFYEDKNDEQNASKHGSVIIVR